jgi:hypothetical protein
VRNSTDSAVGKTTARPCELATVLVHTQRGSKDTGAGVGHTDGLQRALNLPVFTATPVQHDEGTVERTGLQALENLLVGIHGMGIDAPAQQSGKHRAPALERDRTLGRPPAEQHGDLSERIGRLRRRRRHE